MATVLQKELARNIVKNAKRPEKLNKKQLLVLSGYNELTSTHNPKPTLESKGVQEELKNLGFDEESAKKVVKMILINGKEENQLKAAQEIFKVSGSYAPEKHLNVNVPIPIDEIRKNNSVQKDKTTH